MNKKAINWEKFKQEKENQIKLKNAKKVKCVKGCKNLKQGEVYKVKNDYGLAYSLFEIEGTWLKERFEDFKIKEKNTCVEEASNYYTRYSFSTEVERFSEHINSLRIRTAPNNRTVTSSTTQR